MREKWKQGPESIISPCPLILQVIVLPKSSLSYFFLIPFWLVTSFSAPTPSISSLLSFCQNHSVLSSLVSLFLISLLMLSFLALCLWVFRTQKQAFLITFLLPSKTFDPLPIFRTWFFFPHLFFSLVLQTIYVGPPNYSKTEALKTSSYIIFSLLFFFFF